MKQKLFQFELYSRKSFEFSIFALISPLMNKHVQYLH